MDEISEADKIGVKAIQGLLGKGKEPETTSLYNWRHFQDWERERTVGWAWKLGVLTEAEAQTAYPGISL